jgi:DNA-binding transcriptional MerR regulator
MSHRDTRRAALTISEFARLSGLSHKALRLYDLSGLLPPAEIDPANGYRLYSPDQLDRARRISLLRRLDMPLATVAEVLDLGDDEAARRLERWWAAQEAQQQTRRELVEYLRTQLFRTGQEPPRYWVALREAPETKVASIRRDVDQQTLVETMSSCGTEIRAHLAASGAQVDSETWWIYHGLVTPDSEAQVEVCVPFTGPAEPTASIVIRVEPGHTQAYTTVTRGECSYPRIMHAYDAVGRFVRDAELTSFGPPREIYFACWDDIGDGDPFAYVAQPVSTSFREADRSIA